MKNLLLTAFVVFCVIAVLSQYILGQDESLLESQRIGKLKARNADIVGVLNDLSATYRVPIGFERMITKTTERADKPINISLKDISLRQALDEIVKQNPQFNWNIANGVIHIYPNDNPERLSKRLVDCKIAKFDLTGPISYQSIRNRLSELPEVQVIAQSHGVTSNDFQFFQMGIPKRYKFTISLVNPTLRDILDQVVVQGFGEKMWILTVTEKESEEAEFVLNFM